jgi:hypothetical protein
VVRSGSSAHTVIASTAPRPGRGFYVMFRLYSPTEPLFDGTWALPDVELT